MTHEEYKEAAEYWQRKDATGKKLSRDALLTVMEEYIHANKTCALATGFRTFVRCTPIEYSYYDGAFWMFSEGGLKFLALENNKNVCLSIFDSYEGFEKLNGMQITGVAEIAEPFSNEYLKAATFKKLPLEVLKKLSSPMHLIKITPKHIDFLHSAFREQGFSARQSLDF